MGFTNSFAFTTCSRNTAIPTPWARSRFTVIAPVARWNPSWTRPAHLTQFFYDNQGNLTNTLYADGYSVTRAYNLLQQVVTTSDSGGNISPTPTTTRDYSPPSATLLAKLMRAYDIVDRATNTVDANGVSVGMTYDNLDRLLTRSYPDSGVEHWGYT